MVTALDLLGFEAFTRSHNWQKPVHVSIDFRLFEDFSAEHLDRTTQVVQIQSRNLANQDIEYLGLKSVKPGIDPVLPPGADNIRCIIKSIKQLKKGIVRYLLVGAASDNDLTSTFLQCRLETDGLICRCIEIKGFKPVVEAS